MGYRQRSWAASSEVAQTVAQNTHSLIPNTKHVLIEMSVIPQEGRDCYDNILLQLDIARHKGGISSKEKYALERFKAAGQWARRVVPFSMVSAAPGKKEWIFSLVSQSHSSAEHSASTSRTKFF